MPLQDDGDVVHGVGYVAHYAGYLEEQIDNLLFLLNFIEEFTEDEQRWGVGKKIKKAKRLAASIDVPRPERPAGGSRSGAQTL